MRNNPYFNFIKRDSLQMILILSIIILINQGLTAVSNIYMALEPGFDRTINMYSQATAFSSMFCFIAGIMFILRNFSGAISIKGDRKNLLKAFAVWAIIMSSFMVVFSTTLEVGLKILTEVITHKEVTLIGLMLFSLGYMLGAIGYRLKKRTNILVFVVIPVVLIGFLVNSALRIDEFIIIMLVAICNIIVYLVENPGLIILISLICIGVFSLIGTKLLIKAPTKEYSNDLL